MITYSLLKQLADEGFGTLDVDLRHQVIPVDSQGNDVDGVWIISRGTIVSRVNTDIQAFDIYARNKNPMEAQQKLKGILDYLKDAYGEVCTLPATEYTNESYTNVTIEPTSGVENIGQDSGGKPVFAISGEIKFKENI